MKAYQDQNKKRNVAVNSKTADRISPAMRTKFINNYEFCTNHTTAMILEVFKEYVNGDCK